ncbi:VOC family protein [Oleiagrimonas soli]|uniref:Glyoxylase I family protein n=1 Tax=Oleiagrimonas soli TaxID=1543381 RepID=A0A099CUH1_9GAMM|nr:VOC family protein [Oleiagrimonas soli]KGI77341.1 lactoylglutathione lyase [Oleiagrimonas soli]MBB6182743.1 glyoxylase I family protein [Oleiagrimonas soli]
MADAPFVLAQIDHVVLRVRDLDRMRRFYCEVLGCVAERWQEDIGLLQLRAGSSLIDLVSVDGRIGRQGGAAPGKEAHNMDHLCLRVDPFHESAIVAHLQAHDVRIGESGQRYGAQGHGPSLYLYDPEGNMVELKATLDASGRDA